MLWLAILIGVGGISLCAWTLARSRELLLHRMLDGLALLAASVLLCLLLARICQLASIEFTDSKLAPVVAMTRGYHLYQDPDTGVMTGWIYGPVGALVMLPAALGKTPTTCGFIGTTIAVIFYFAPAFWLMWIVAGRRFTPLLMTAMLAFAWMSLASDDLISAALLAGPDAPAIGFAACACGALLLPRSMTTRILSAAAAVLAVWSKQNYALLIVGLALWVLLEEGWQGALIYISIAVLIGLGLAVPFAAGFGASNMWFHMFALPASHPFKHSDLGPWMMWLTNIKLFMTPLAPGAALVLLAALLDRLAAPMESKSYRAWLVTRRWPMLTIVALSFLPGGFLGLSKVGGGSNNLAPTHYFLVLSALSGVLLACQAGSAAFVWRRHLQTALAIMSLGFAVQALFDPPSKDVPIWSHLAHPYDNSTEMVFRYAKNHPNQVFCPWNPLVTLLADDKLYHFECGFFDRAVGGKLKSDEQVFRHLPSNFSELIYINLPPSRFMEAYLHDFRRPAYRPELPNCIVITR